MDIADDGDRPRRYIDHDTWFETDISQMTRRVLEEVWGPNFDADTLKARFVDPDQRRVGENLRQRVCDLICD